MSAGSFIIGAFIGGFITLAAIVAFIAWATDGDW